jgi:hypothetical protein
VQFAKIKRNDKLVVGAEIFNKIREIIFFDLPQFEYQPRVVTIILLIQISFSPNQFLSISGAPRHS